MVVHKPRTQETNYQKCGQCQVRGFNPRMLWFVIYQFDDVPELSLIIDV